jgi:hypothetical protein
MGKRFNFKKSALAMAVVMASGYMGTATAHSFTGTVANGRTEALHFQCFTDTNGSTGVSTLAGQEVYIKLVSGTVRAEIGHIQMATPTNENWTGQQAVSSIGSEAALVPPAGKVAGIWSGKGYIVNVTNTSGSSQAYDVTVHCQRTHVGAVLLGVETGTGDLILNSTSDPTVDFTTVISN